MHVEEFSIEQQLQFVYKKATSAVILSKFFTKQIWSPSDRQEILNILAKLLLLPSCTDIIITHFYAMIPDILIRAKQSVKNESYSDCRSSLCAAMASVAVRIPECRTIVMDYFNKLALSQDSYQLYFEGGQNKVGESKSCSLHLLHAFYRLLMELPSFGELLTFKSFLSFLNSEKTEVRWFAVQIIGMLANMSDSQLRQFEKRFFSKAEVNSLHVRNDVSLERFQNSVHVLRQPDVCHFENDSRRYTMGSLTKSDFVDDVVSICGILLQSANKVFEVGMLVPVRSSQDNLRLLALAVASGSPALLQGPVGCGKTALVEELALLTGRSECPHLLKIQLGDQMDAKALLGTYHCTEVPGEFVWQPGSLTQAVVKGYWILLEDIDYAPKDVISVLLPLLESGYLSIPGHGDKIHAAPGFHLFATQRLFGSSTGLFTQQNNNSALLDKLWSKINVEPMSRSELQMVVTTKYPSLTSVCDRLLDIYFLISSGKHEQDVDMEGDNSDIGKYISHEGRQISSRDLLKWCSRIIGDVDLTSASGANRIFQEALDCFIMSVNGQQLRLAAAEAISTKLNMLKSKAEFFCNKYKPSVIVNDDYITVGRAKLRRKIADYASVSKSSLISFAFTRQAAATLESIAVAVDNQEPVLLVGETGTGKTSCIQYLAWQTGHKLNVVNMNQQSDSADLLGGFKPVDLRHLVAPLKSEFETLFCKCFSRKKNIKFLGHVQECFHKRRWSDLFKLMRHTHKSALKRYQHKEQSAKEKNLLTMWESLSMHIDKLKKQVSQVENALVFSFVEGTLVKAIKNGEWILLDEINLATAETLECLSGLLESTTGSIVLLERGDTKPIKRHEDFRLFACMNPATDVGKKDLPAGVRNRFTELFVHELQDVSDLKILVNSYLKGLSLSAAQVDGIVNFYLRIQQEGRDTLTDGTGHRPHYSLRTLCRALQQASLNTCQSTSRSLYEAFCLSFLTQLDRSSHPVVQQLIGQYVVGKSNLKGFIAQALPQPAGDRHINFEGYWIMHGTEKPLIDNEYVLTPSVRDNLRDLARIVSAGRFPVLLQGETSVGKTSLVQWLAKATGNMCVRVNNHEHTDLQEYVGSYAADESGKLVFKEGVLVDAMRKGYWIILDELNLAPTDVLEALNRVLDDNRELYISETQETVAAHPQFMLFATQNPPGLYGGRKILSRAFKNRFVELHFDEIPSKELEVILHERCQLPQSYCRKMVSVMLELRMLRRSTGVFAGKQGYMTLRDLFRWAERYGKSEPQTEKYYDWDQHIAEDGYMLLAGRVRKPDECLVIQTVLEKHFRKKIDLARLFSNSTDSCKVARQVLQRVECEVPDGFQHIVWTYSMRRMAILIGQALKYGEPVLLVGDTGCGKTTICQYFAAVFNRKLYAVNCHLHTETSDFLGGLRPVRHRAEEDSQKLFEWADGPLVSAMREGALFLMDEISLADDSVLERLNSVLEPERKLLLAEKGCGEDGQKEVEQIIGADGFRVVATMNPGGDFGKKELSPALRNRFTEIWCPHDNSQEDMVAIIEHNIKPGLSLANQEDGTSGVGNAIINFLDWFVRNNIGKRFTISIRDILSWVSFINTCAKSTVESENESLFDPAVAYIHGACLVFLDGLGSGVATFGSSLAPAEARSLCLGFLVDQIFERTHQHVDPSLLTSCSASGSSGAIKVSSETFGIEPFYIKSGNESSGNILDSYSLSASTPCMNAQRILRALQLNKPILLEGAPGVGKTSLVAAIAEASGHSLVRINLSEQTDVTDLFGADLPMEGGVGGEFAWRDGPLLQALKQGHWIVLDELNLASQSVLEGLNACLDHRGQIFVPELAMTFHIQHDKTRIFACQNPLHQGGGRKGLPRSFLNRFTQVFVEPLSAVEFLFITQILYPGIPAGLLSKMIEFNSAIMRETIELCQWGRRGSPWEFNLRDIFRWCSLIVSNQPKESYNPGGYVGLVYADRMRSVDDRVKVYELYEKIFGTVNYPAYHPSCCLSVTPKYLQVGHSFLKRNVGNKSLRTTSDVELLRNHLPALESLMKCIQMNYVAILIGPQSCGKTSIVEALSQLTGHSLKILAMNSSMDTIELLGGFEQADPNRYVEELVANVQAVYEELLRHLLLEEQKPQLTEAEELTTAWENFRLFKKSAYDLSKTDRHANIQKQFKLLHVLLEIMVHLSDKVDTFTFREKVEALQYQLISLQAKLDAEGPSGGGGLFEWVDSILVKALENGDWLLVDNVNFCNASVLDRLNGLLEPGGVLSINERGVINGEIPTVKPHPDFRLIFAMDPKHGEISRAMRNRGVEICILGQEADSELFDDFDTKLMLHNIGLEGKLTCNKLISLNSAIKEDIYSSGTLIDLLQSAKLTVQYLRHGYSLSNSLYNASNDVYVRNQMSTDKKKRAKEIVEFHLMQPVDVHQFLDDPASLYEAGVWPYPLPSIKRISLNSMLSTVQRDGALLSFLVSKYTPDNACLYSAGMINHLLIFSLLVFLEHSSDCDWNLRQVWLENLVKQQAVEEQHSENDTLLGQQMIEVANQICTTAFQSVAANLITSHKCALTDEFDLIYQPMDMRLNIQLVNHISINIPHAMGVIDKMTMAFRNVFLLMRFTQQRFLDSLVLGANHQANFQSKRRKKKKFSHIQGSFMRISQALDEGTIPRDDPRLPHPVVNHLSALFLRFNEAVIKVLNEMNSLTQECMETQINAMQWRKYLWLVCCSEVDCSEEHLSLLRLHWDWFYSKTLPIMFPNTSMPAELKTVVNKVEQVLGTNSKLLKALTKFTGEYGSPLPFPSSDVAEVFHRLLSLSQYLTLSDVLESVDINSRIRFLLSEEGSRVKQLLFSALMCSRFEISEWAKQVATEVESSLEAARIVSRDCAMETDEEEQCKTPDSCLSEVPLWPITDHLSCITQARLVGSILNREDCSDDEITQFLTFSKNFTPASVEHFLSLAEYRSAFDKAEFLKVCKQELLLQHFKHQWLNTVNNNVLTLLLWNQQISENNADLSTKFVPLLNPMQTYCAASFLQGSDFPNGQVSLGQAHQKRRQLQHLSLFLWQNMSFIQKDNSKYDMMMLKAVYSDVAECVKALNVLNCGTSQEVRNTPQRSATDVCTDLCKTGFLPSSILPVLLMLDSDMQKLENFWELENASPRNLHKLHCIGHAWSLLGLLQVHLLAPRYPVDPAEKVQIRLKYVGEEIEEIEAELKVRDTMYFIKTGLHLVDNVETSVDMEKLHNPPDFGSCIDFEGILKLTCNHHADPRCVYLVQRLQYLRVKREGLLQKQAARPVPSQFDQLVKDVKHYLLTIGAIENVQELLLNLENVTCAKADTFLYKVKQWLTSQEKFVSKLSGYRLYEDITIPVVSAVYQVMHGVQLVTRCVEVQAQRTQLHLSQEMGSFQCLVVSSFVPLPVTGLSYPGSLNIAKTFLKRPANLIKLMQTSMCSDIKGNSSVGCNLVLELAMMSVQLTKNHILVNQNLDEQSLAVLFGLFGMFVKQWQQWKDDQKRKEEEEASLYRYKDQTHGDSLTDEQREEKDFQNYFPSFDTIFEDLTKDEDAGSDVATQHFSNLNAGDMTSFTLTTQNMAEICRVHTLLFSLFTETDWICKPKTAEPLSMVDFVQPFRTGYKILSNLVQHNIKLFDSVLDWQMISSHLVMSKLQQASLSEQENVPSNFQHHYDIYHDPNVAEVMKCRPILEDFSARVKSLLLEFPDHPALKQVLKVINKILSLPVTGSLMSFVAGLELLLSRSQDFEVNAHRGISLYSHLEEISRQIIEWRKLELKCWRSCLDRIDNNVAEKATEWWFHIYTLVDSFLNSDIEGADSSEKKTEPFKSLVTSLQQYVEGSNLGDFQTRLQILYSFHCQLAVMAKSQGSDVLKFILKLLWNVHQYYSQFSDGIASCKLKLRAPIEKEIKDFVRIAKWSDINFWAMKAAVEKTHKTLHKFIRRYQDVLAQPVRAVLTDTNMVSDSPHLPETNKFDILPDDFIANVHLLPESDDKLSVEQISDKTSVLQRIPSLFSKMRKLSREVICKQQYLKLTAILDDFTGEVIEGVRSLQALDINHTNTKEKQVAEAKSIHLRKRRALAELFRYLTQMGLSYRKGLSLLRQADSFQLMVCEPVDVTAALNSTKFNSSDASTFRFWHGCSKYFYKCIARRAALLSTMESPSKELGLSNIERCRGYSEHLMDIVTKEHNDIAHCVTDLVQLRSLCMALCEIKYSAEPLAVPPQAEMKKFQEEILNLVGITWEYLQQLLLFFDSCPAKHSSQTFNVLPMLGQPLLSQLARDDDSCQEIISKLNTAALEVQNVQKAIKDSRGNQAIIVTWHAFEELKIACAKLDNVAESLKTVLKFFEDPEAEKQTLAAGFSLESQLNKLCNLTTQFLTWATEINCLRKKAYKDCNATTEHAHRISSLVTKVLYNVQELYKKLSLASNTEHGKDEEEDGLSDDDGIQDGHLNSKLHIALQSDISSLKLSSITVELETILQLILQGQPPSVNKELLLLTKLAPIFDQYACLVQLFLTEYIAVHRTACKLLYVLLGIFCELGQKGFCLPSGLSDEIAEEGATEFEDIEGGGIGEGEGVKDVSDQIEAEDQLDEMKKENEEQQNDNENRPDLKDEEGGIEMSDDFEGKMHDIEQTGDDDDDEHSGSDSEEENTLDKQMGDVDQSNDQKLDEQLWGSDSEDEEEEQNKEERGAGDGKQKESRIAAKEDDDDDGMGNDMEQKKEQEQIDEGEYQGEGIDPYHQQQQEQQQEPEPMDLPDDLDLDHDDKDEEEPDPEGGNASDADDHLDGDDDAGETEDADTTTKDEELTEEKVQSPMESNTEEPGQDTDEIPGENPTDDTEENERVTKPDEKDTHVEEGQTDDAAVSKTLAPDTTNSLESHTQSQIPNDENKAEQVGMASSEQSEDGRSVDSTAATLDQASGNDAQQHKRAPGKSDPNRSIGSTDEPLQKRLKIVDAVEVAQQERLSGEKRSSDLYQHIKDAKFYDAQTDDAATRDEALSHPVPRQEEQDGEELRDDSDDIKPLDKQEEKIEDEREKIYPKKFESTQQQEDNDVEMEDQDQAKGASVELAGEKVETTWIERNPESTIHTNIELFNWNQSNIDLETLRLQLEKELTTWSHPELQSCTNVQAAQDAWQKYESLTSDLARELCEQLRLVLEPTQASKLRGDFRTGKRLNMRKVIPYIASQFRKDKIWLRRTKPNKRNYQIMLAVDDSSSMVDNHSKQMAFESLAVIANALSWLEAGELHICSFGQEVRQLHAFTEQFSNQSGASVLQSFTFEQKKTRIAQLLNYALDVMLSSRKSQQLGNMDTAQLLLIVSDGRGLFAEGVDVVKRSVRRTRDANIFTVFVVLDNPKCKDSILDIRVPVFKGPGEVPEIRTYMDYFPFPFYIILRDVNRLPVTLGDALRQWFELVTNKE